MATPIEMPSSAVLETPGPAPLSRAEVAAVLVMSFASLLLELSLTRIFSVVLFYHFAFLAISIALLGLGAGGVFAHVRKAWLEQWTLPVLGTWIAAANALLLLGVLELDLHLAVSLDTTWANFLRLTAVYLASSLPFFLTGTFFSVLFARRGHDIPRLYAADLAGGAAACLAVVPLLNFLGGPNTVLSASGASAIAAIVWSPGGKLKKIAWAVFAAFALLIAANYSGRLIDIVYAKGMRRDKPWVLFARWNALSRVEVDDQGGAKAIVIDADASTYIMNTDPYHWGPEWHRHLMQAPPAVANVLRPHGTYAIIGPGGGVDVLRALANGSPSVTGIEINPIIVNDIMRGRWAEWSYYLYDRPEVHIHVADGRSWVRASHERYDVVQMTLVDTWASTAAGALALSENSLYTTQAFREYFEHLNPEGMLAITRWEFAAPHEALRVVSLAMEALGQLGVGAKELPQHFIVISDGALDVNGRAVAVLAKKSAFTAAEQDAVAEHLRDNPNLVLLYSPQPALASTLPPGAAPFGDLLKSGDPARFARNYDFNVSAVSDDSPFFFFTTKPAALLKGTADHGMGWKNSIGLVVLGMVLVIAACSVLAFLVLPLLLSGGAAASHGGRRMLFFIAIGLGYILAEIAFIQRLVLFLGHPTYALTVVIFLMLLASGAGSLLSRRWPAMPARIVKPIAFTVVVLGLYVWILPPVLASLVGIPFAAKLCICTAVIGPPAFAMGMPFPSGLRALAGGGAFESGVEWAWSVNAGATVLGSVLAIVVAIEFGLSATLACAAGSYAGAAALAPLLIRRIPDSPRRH
ncbi:MAG: hypothetical protein JO041_01625 [Acidobacteria bacterium]|nr:hypothetical protein [Acidobacteriota bacterium]